MLIRSRRQILSIVLLAVMVFGACAGPGVTAAGGKPSGVVTCQDGGYLTWADGDRKPFRNAGYCISYVKEGGILTSAPRIVMTFQYPFDTWCESGFELSDFPALTEVDVTMDGLTSTSGEHVIWELDVTTDASGYASAGAAGLDRGTTTVTATFTTASGPVTIVDTFPCGIYVP